MTNHRSAGSSRHATVGGDGRLRFFRAVAERGIAYRASLRDAAVTPTATPTELRASLGGPTPELRADPVAVVNRMADAVEEGGLMGMDSGRFFGFVIARGCTSTAPSACGQRRVEARHVSQGSVPYDCGIVICRHSQSHRAAMTVTAAYLVQAGPGTDRDPVDWNPEFSRRARGIPVYAALASLGREGIEEIIERCCAHARRFAELLGAESG